ncbi:MAG: IS3 family transposase [Gammaproteobacteria bacterium]|nr:IS3 family transposase [Gammaproteobacteria bacterium]MDE0249253.1 IS3 family transposase [Gammaproteobacteria bacterium]
MDLIRVTPYGPAATVRINRPDRRQHLDHDVPNRSYRQLASAGASIDGYSDWLRRGPSARERRDAELRRAIRRIWIESEKIYGCPRIHAALRDEGERVSRKRVARLMREMGIEGVTRRRFKGSTTKREAGAKAAPDLVKREFSADGPDRLCVADITYVPTLGRLALPRGRGGRLEPSGRGVLDGEADADPAGQGRTDDGGHAPPAEARVGPPLR